MVLSLEPLFKFAHVPGRNCCYSMAGQEQMQKKKHKPGPRERHVGQIGSGVTSSDPGKHTEDSNPPSDEPQYEPRDDAEHGE